MCRKAAGLFLQAVPASLSVNAHKKEADNVPLLLFLGLSDIF